MALRKIHRQGVSRWNLEDDITGTPNTTPTETVILDRQTRRCQIGYQRETSATNRLLLKILEGNLHQWTNVVPYIRDNKIKDIGKRDIQINKRISMTELAYSRK